MNPIKYDELIDRQVKDLTFSEKKEVFDYVEFLKLKRFNENAFNAALKQGQTIGKQLGVTDKDINKEIKLARRIKRG